MLTEHALERQANSLESMFYSAEVEIDGVIKPATLLKERKGTNKVTFLLRLQDSETGMVTKRVIRDENGQIVWQDTVDFYKPARAVALSIPIELKWKVGE
ncbi:hypothetical protein [Brevibacillus borstelensis]|uniref:hypothetical protein n=1 Tax=Brevibacillus borstelensis TaxID=45462 RepID=UPI0030F755F9